MALAEHGEVLRTALTSAAWFGKLYGVDLETLWGFIRVGDDDECWPWTRGTDQDGYGLLWVRDHENGTRKQWRVTRLIWSLLYPGDDLPAHVCHSCDNPPCCNPAHLWAGDAKANYEDMASKGRRGFIRTNAKLTDEVARSIRARYAKGGTSYRLLAEEHGVSIGCIQQLIQGRTWKTA